MIGGLNRCAESPPDGNWSVACALLVLAAIWLGGHAMRPRPRACRRRWCKAYQTNPQLNAERARQRGTDENVPQALAGYRPQIVASLGAGLQAVRNLLPDNTIQTRDAASVDDRGDGHPGAVQRLQDRQQRSGRRISGAVGPRGVAECRPGRAAGCRDGLHECHRPTTRWYEAQRTNVAGAARNPGDHETAARCRRRDADGYGAGRGAAEPGTGGSQRGRGRARHQQGDLRAGDRRRAVATGRGRAGRPAGRR